MEEEPQVATTPKNEKSRRKRKNKVASATKEHRSLTVRNPTWSYLHLELVAAGSSNAEAPQLDAVTSRSYLTSALHQYLGLTGTAIPIDILKISDDHLWIRVPREDNSAVMAALGGWVGGANTETPVGWKIAGTGKWLTGLLGRSQEAKIWEE